MPGVRHVQQVLLERFSPAFNEQRLTQNLAVLGLHRPAAFRSPSPEPFHDFLIQISDDQLCHCGHLCDSNDSTARIVALRFSYEDLRQPGLRRVLERSARMRGVYRYTIVQLPCLCMKPAPSPNPTTGGGNYSFPTAFFSRFRNDFPDLLHATGLTPLSRRRHWECFYLPV